MNLVLQRFLEPSTTHSCGHSAASGTMLGLMKPVAHMEGPGGTGCLLAVVHLRSIHDGREISIAGSGLCGETCASLLQALHSRPSPRLKRLRSCALDVR